jgi:hypothetical protein
VPVPLETQAELLAAAGEYQEALALAALASARTPAQAEGQQRGRQQQQEQPRALLASPQGNWHPVMVRVCLFFNILLAAACSSVGLLQWASP